MISLMAASGLATVVGLASHGAKVYLAARSEAKALAAIQEIKTQLPNADVEFLQLDLASLASVVAAAETIRRLVAAIMPGRMILTWRHLLARRPSSTA